MLAKEIKVLIFLTCGIYQVLFLPISKLVTAGLAQVMTQAVVSVW